MARVLKHEAAKRDFPLQDGVDLVRVVHGSRDPEQLLVAGFCG